MSKTYKDRDKIGRPRVPEWARAKPTLIHKNKKKDRQQDLEDPREEYLYEIYEQSAE